MFRDQVGILASWFKGWNECEQTVALLSLLKRVTRTQARFLQLCLEHSLADCNDIHLLESEANSAGESAPRDGSPVRRAGQVLGAAEANQYWSWEMNVLCLSGLLGLCCCQLSSGVEWGLPEGGQYKLETVHIERGRIVAGLFELLKGTDK